VIGSFGMWAMARRSANDPKYHLLQQVLASAPSGSIRLGKGFRLRAFRFETMMENTNCGL